MNKVISSPSEKENQVRELFGLGVHFGYSRIRRHPSVDKFVFGYKSKNAIIDLEKTIDSLVVAKDFVKTLGREGKQLLLVGNKSEAREAVKKAAARADLPYVAERWIGGTLTNSTQIKNRVKRLEQIEADEASGELAKYTKKERGLIAKEKRDLDRYFGGIVKMPKMPGALFVVDAQAEAIAVAEANKLNIPVISLSSSDCDIRPIDYPIIGNDSAVASVTYFLNQIVSAYKEGVAEAVAVATTATEEIKADPVTS
ncbi:MAG: 30S ribosomal protein S2 [Candidatus Vogelbacteria bacterium RIFOXYD1_FULL_46_19]|uniref:Small ribosomal subunit protein uS2 n=1 Tax=Candidatus Vogelbacteria bacterium RIFOXYD1_FULL_46_19 TaxID=1802439 RepID=A0A1G2QG77_9BACT|nr:MAG: 30S ribosomal protein S2 [Candidatus Vogelbacteria bacterium RIFOXYD1_FULL_46_19]